MKNLMIVMGMFLSISMLMAGGNIAPSINTDDMSNKTCKANKIYLERDVQLMWQDQVYANKETSAYKRNFSSAKAGTWKHAVNYCRSLNYVGYSDWRLPTADELTNVHRKKGKAFTYNMDSDFWTSTPSTENKYYVVYPADAYRYKRYSKESNYIRCVRCADKEIETKKYLFSSTY